MKTANINGVTFRQITGIMLRTEKRIAFLNKKYNFDVSLGTVKEIKQYESDLRTWDFLKKQRDSLK